MYENEKNEIVAKRSIQSTLIETALPIALMAVPLYFSYWIWTLLFGIDIFVDIILVLVMIIELVVAITLYIILSNTYYKVYPIKLILKEDRLEAYYLFRKEEIRIDSITIKKERISTAYINHYYRLQFNSQSNHCIFRKGKDSLYNRGFILDSYRVGNLKKLIDGIENKKLVDDEALKEFTK